MDIASITAGGYDTKRYNRVRLEASRAAGDRYTGEFGDEDRPNRVDLLPDHRNVLYPGEDYGKEDPSLRKSWRQPMLGERAWNETYVIEPKQAAVAIFGFGTTAGAEYAEVITSQVRLVDDNGGYIIIEPVQGKIVAPETVGLLTDGRVVMVEPGKRVTVEQHTTKLGDGLLSIHGVVAQERGTTEFGRSE